MQGSRRASSPSNSHGGPTSRFDRWNPPTDHAIFRLGDALSARSPRIAWASDQPAKDHAWLPRLAPHLPLDLPEPIALGDPAEGYPWRWSVCTWLPGVMATPEHLASRRETAEDLARFLLALWTIDAEGGPPPEGRGGPLAPRDEACRASIAKLRGVIDTAWAETEWQAALGAPPLVGAPRVAPRRSRCAQPPRH